MKRTIQILEEILESDNFELDEQSFDELLKQLEELTDYNNHTEALLEVAKYFNLTEYIPQFEKIIDYADRNNGLDFVTVQLRNSMATEMFKKIEEMIGTEYTHKLYSVL